MARVLLIDDDANLREVLSFTLRDQGHEVDAARDGPTGLAALDQFHPEVVVTDLKMPGMDGLEVLRHVTERDATIPVILLTAFGSIADAVEAMKLGAHNYLTKPCNRDELKVVLEQALDRRRLLLENRNLRDRLREQSHRVDIVHASDAMEQILEMIRRIAPTDAPC
jgi:DNA-binding NtrC family response regulator